MTDFLLNSRKLKILRYCGEVLCVLIFLVQQGSGQPLGEQEPFVGDGYIKNMQVLQVEDLDRISTYHLLHNRINTDFYPFDPLSITLELRNRLYYGEVVKRTPKFSEVINENDDVLDLSHFWLEKRSVIAHSVIDRAYIDYKGNSFNIRLGRQRINWGVSQVWNPNDIFNTYSYFDFDYEERQGSDALRFQYFTGVASRWEGALKVSENIDSLVAAGLYRWNVKNYDVQVLAGIRHEDIVIGSGWAGHIKNAGFKGEASYFHPYHDPQDTLGVISATTMIDYSFPSGFYISGAFLFNSNGQNTPIRGNLIQTDISPKNLLPYKYSIFLQGSYPFNPIFQGSLSTMYSPGAHSLFIFPQLNFSIEENWQLDVISQLLFAKQEESFQSRGKYFFVRLQWSY